ncbi:MAG: anti-sigma factor antagonist, partial [Gammaproteobacteria bacterium]
ESGTVVVAISGTFDFKCVHDFRAAYQDLPDASTYVVDLADVTHMDSSALGMLLNMRRSVGEDKQVVLRRAQPTVRKILEISRFDKMFTLEG